MKKWLLVLGIATCLLGLTACGSNKEEAKFVTESEALEFGDYVVEYINSMVAQGAVSQFEAGSWEVGAAESWTNGLKEMGSYKGISGHKADISENEVVISVSVTGETHDAVVEIIVNKDEGMQSVTTNVKYSFGELMTKATLNTILGMGTTFVILILISLIISCFTLIPKIQAGFGKKTEREEMKTSAVDNTIAQIIEKEELADDSELVAVIAAAIAASQGASSTDGFRVRSIRRSNSSKWKQA